jgi:hypothetical protein
MPMVPLWQNQPALIPNWQESFVWAIALELI